MCVIREVLNCKPGKVRQMVEKFLANETLRKTMVDYHDLIDRGRREIYRLRAKAYGRLLRRC